MDGKSEFKLGQIFNAVCYWDPQTENMFYIRPVDEEEAIKADLDPLTRLNKEKEGLDLKEVKNELIKVFKKFCSERYANFLLYSLFSDECMFINGDNFEPLVQEFHPRVFRLNLKAPFKDSLFPYKNENSELIQTPMQMSDQSTYLILDFSELSSKDSDQVKI